MLPPVADATPATDHRRSLRFIANRDPELPRPEARIRDDVRPRHRRPPQPIRACTVAPATPESVPVTTAPCPPEPPLAVLNR